MNDTDLIRMANQIADNLAIYGEDQAISDTADHLQSFWEPRMLDALKTLAPDQGTALTPIARAAVARLTNA